MYIYRELLCYVYAQISNRQLLCAIIIIHACLLFFCAQTSVIMSTKMAFDYMSTNKGGKGGVIVNISSAAG